MNRSQDFEVDIGRSGRSGRLGPMKAVAGGLALALAGAAALPAWAQPSPPPEGGRPHGHVMQGGPMGGAGMGGAVVMRALRDPSVTEAQRTQIRQIMEAAAADTRAQRDTTRSLHQQAVQLFAAPNVDATAVENVRSQLTALHDQTSRRMVQAMVDASRVLTPEQRARMAERLQHRMGRKGERLHGPAR